jgi:hypothetical protein
MKVTANLLAALDDLRDENQLLLLWVDAICIDQMNVSERNYQVGLMRDIYSTAQRTVVYLGSGRRDLDNLFLDLQNRERQYSTINTRSLNKSSVAPLDPSLSKELLSAPWFTRVWVYQELVLSKEVSVQYGRNRAKWDNV